MSSFNGSTPNFDNLLLQTLMGRLQIRPPPLHSPSFLSSESIDDLLFSNLLSDSDSDKDSDHDDSSSSKTQLAKEESKLEKEIIRTILSGKAETLKPNSGQAVSIGEHHICVGFHEDTGSDYRVWEWHGHIMLFDEESGYTPEYIYGNYFERVAGKQLKKKHQSEDTNNDDDDDVKRDEKEKVANLGLRELIVSGDSGSSRVLHRNINAASPSIHGHLFSFMVEVKLEIFGSCVLLIETDELLLSLELRPSSGTVEMNFMLSRVSSLLSRRVTMAKLHMLDSEQQNLGIYKFV